MFVVAFDVLEEAAVNPRIAKKFDLTCPTLARSGKSAISRQLNFLISTRPSRSCNNIAE